MTTHDEHAVTVEGLTKRYRDVLAVDRISFEVRRGEVFAFLGPNGAGKTTTVEIICGLRRASAGTVRVLGMDVVTQRREIVRRIGVLPQGGSSFDRLTVRETIAYHARLFGVRNVDIDGLSALMDLTDRRDMEFRHLSGGMRQRLGIVTALVNDPDVIFLDEPTTGLDPHARRAVWDTLEAVRAGGKTVFLTTHYMEEAEVLADTVAIISDGRIIATGAPQALVDASDRAMDLTLSSVDPRAFDLLRRMGLAPVRITQDTVTLRVATTDEVHGLIGAMKDAGIPLPHIGIRRPTLEEVYLDLTAAAASGAAPATPNSISSATPHGTADGAVRT